MLLRILKAIVHRLFQLLFSLEYQGLEHVPAQGSVILAGNHPSYLDPVLVSLAIPRKIRFMAWDALFKVPVLGTMIRGVGAFPVDLRKGKGEAAFQEALKVLQAGETLGIFPEGQRSERGPMGELRTGVARLAVETGAPIVPITIGGAFRAWPKWRLFPKPAKIIVRFHAPMVLAEADRSLRRNDKTYHQEVMQEVAGRINRSLVPALGRDALYERWYRQPPPNIRSYEWGPLITASIALAIILLRGRWQKNWIAITIPTLGYYLYLLADLMMIKPSRMAKWLRNSMPVWLILIWHRPLTGALSLPFGERNDWLVLTVLAVFFAFFYEDYFTVQKFVRGLVVTYYFSLALLLKWPQGLGTFAAILFFLAVFAMWHRVIQRWSITLVSITAMTLGLVFSQSSLIPILPFLGLGMAANAYLGLLVSMAYDIRRAGSLEAEER